MLEAAWPQLETFFGAAPTLGDGERLEVFFGASQASFFARLEADGIRPPDAGGYYAPKTKVAYLWRQPTIYNTRCLLIHETTHQFHYLSRTHNHSVGVEWYVEGLAEFLGRHTWDGEHLVIGALPLLSLSDYPQAASERLSSSEVDLQAVVDGEVSGRPLYFALVRYLVKGGGDRLFKRFKRLSRKLDAGGVSPKAFSQIVGSPRKLESAFLDWLRREQEPWRQIFNEWEGIGPGRFQGTAGGAIVTTCAVKGPALRLDATLEVPDEGSWVGGVLLSHVDGEGKDGADYTTALCHGARGREGGRERRVVRRQGGKWVRLGTFPCPASRVPGRLHFALERRGQAVTLRVEGKTMGVFDLPSLTFGLALQGSTLRYRDVTWE